MQSTARRTWETDEIAAFRARAREFFRAELVPHDERWRKQRGVDRAFYRKAGQAGLLCPSIPVEYGGLGGNFAHVAVVQEELGRVGCSSFGQVPHGAVCAHYLNSFGTEDQKRRWLPGLCSGELVAAIAMTEPHAGTDVQAFRVRAERRAGADHYLLNGVKSMISNGQLADIVIVAAKTDLGANGKGITLLVVEANDSEGFYRSEPLDKIGMHGQDTSELYFEDLAVPLGNRLGEEGDGYVQMMTLLAQERMGMAVFCQALLERAVELTMEHARERKVFNAPLMELQNTRFKLAECETIGRVSRAFIDNCIADHMHDRLSTTDASMAKYWASEQLCRVADECLQLFGGAGYVATSPIARIYVDARAQRILGGVNEVMKELIFRTI